MTEWSKMLVALQVTGVAEPMTWRARLFVTILGIVVLAFVVNLVRTRKLKEEYALLWLAAALVLVISPLIVDWLDTLAAFIGIEYAPALIFLLAVICFLFLFFQFSLSVSRFSEQIKSLTQDLGLLRQRVEQLEQRVVERDTARDTARERERV